MKKLDLTDGKKDVLLHALWETADTMDAYMRRIYDDTANQTLSCPDKIYLTDAMASISVYALERYARIHGEDPLSKDMLAQLTLTRKEYAALHSA